MLNKIISYGNPLIINNIRNFTIPIDTSLNYKYAYTLNEDITTNWISLTIFINSTTIAIAEFVRNIIIVPPNFKSILVTSQLSFNKIDEITLIKDTSIEFDYTFISEPNIRNVEIELSLFGYNY